MNNTVTDLFRQIKAFIIVGLCTAILDYLVLFLLAEIISINYLTSAAMAFVLASSLNYFLSVRFVFEAGKYEKKIVEFNVFLILLFVGLLLNHFFMLVLIEILGVYLLLAKGVSLIVITFFNFLTKKFIVFKN